MPHPLLADRGYLRDDQYRDSSNLRARQGLHTRFSTNPYPWQRWVFDHLLCPNTRRAGVPAGPSLPQEAAIRELGCGPGWLWRENAERIPSGWRVLLSDLSSGMVHDAQASLAPRCSARAYAVADAQSLPFAAGAFDAVIANHRLYHVPDLPRALAEIARVLKPGGRLFAATNGAGHMAEVSATIEELAPRHASPRHHRAL